MAVGKLTTILALAVTTLGEIGRGQTLFNVLVFSKTTGFRHPSIPNGIAMIQELGAQHNFSVTATEDGGAFSDTGLTRFQAVVFLNTTGDVLNDSQQTSFEQYIQGSGGYVGIHSASDTEYGWPWYGQLVGAYFASHPTIQQAVSNVVDSTHPSTDSLPRTWIRTDEWYNFQTNPRPNVHVLATLNESTYIGGTMGDHPISWFHYYDGGRAWYTGMGHTEGSYSEPLYRAHVLGAIEWAAGRRGIVAMDDDSRTIPDRSALRQNYPNPFNPSTTIRFALRRSDRVTLKVFDLLGQEVATLVDGERSAGAHSVEWKPADLSSGVYFYTLSTGNHRETRKLILIQ